MAMDRLFVFTARLIVGAVIGEDQKRFLMKQFKVPIEKIDELLAWDPSPGGKFMTWLVKWDKAGKIDQSISKNIEKYLSLFADKEWMKGRRERNFGELTPEELKELTEKKPRILRKETPDAEIEKAVMEKGLPGAQMIVNEDKWKVWRVTNVRYCMMLSKPGGNGLLCRWCTKQESWATTYLSNGPVWPIYKDGVPYAQAHVGKDSSTPTAHLILLDKDDHKFEITPELLELFSILKPLPDFKFWERYVWQTISKTPDDPQLLEIVKGYIDETQDPRLMTIYLKKHWEPEYLMTLLEDDYTIGLKKLMDEAIPEVKTQIMTSEFAPEMLPYLHSVTAGMFPMFLTEGLLDTFFKLPLSGGKVNLSTLALPELKKLTAWVLSKDRSILNDMNEAVDITSPAFTQAVLFPFWRKNMAAQNKFFSGPRHKQMMEVEPYRASYEKYKTEAPVVKVRDLPEKLEVGDTVKRGPSWNDGTADGEPGNTGQITERDGNERDGNYYRVVFEGQTGSNWFLYNIEQRRIFIVPVDCEYQPTGAEPINAKIFWEDEEFVAKRNRQPQELEVGDRVIRGPEWSDGEWDRDRDGKPGIGTVERVQASVAGWSRYSVRWDNGQNETYKYSVPGKLEIVSRKAWTGEDEPAAPPARPTTAVPANLPERLQVGSRVKRGPNWSYGDQDTDHITGEQREGSVIHVEEEHVGEEDELAYWVEWDGEPGQRYSPHGMNYQYIPGRTMNIVPVADVEATPEEAPSTEIRVGTRVRRGPDWHYEEQDGGGGQGVVTSFEPEYEADEDSADNAEFNVHVRWDNGRSYMYRYYPDASHREIMPAGA